MEHSPSVVAVTGELDLATAGQWEGDVEAAGRVSSAVVLDLSGVWFIDSAGVRKLFRWALAAERVGIRLVVVAPHDGPVWRLLDILHLESIAPVYESRDEALRKVGWPVDGRVEISRGRA
jgi:anti-sigma B factor antagonist